MHLYRQNVFNKYHDCCHNCEKPGYGKGKHSYNSLSIFFLISQSQKEELDSALKALAANGDEKVKAGIEKENTKLKEELSSLPELKKELESLRARVTELSQLTGII